MYKNLVDAVNGLGEGAIDQVADQVVSFDKALSRMVSAVGLPHYEIKYNEFMAVKAP